MVITICRVVMLLKIAIIRDFIKEFLQYLYMYLDLSQEKFLKVSFKSFKKIKYSL